MATRAYLPVAAQRVTFDYDEGPEGLFAVLEGIAQLIWFDADETAWLQVGLDQPLQLMTDRVQVTVMEVRRSHVTLGEMVEADDINLRGLVP